MMRVKTPPAMAGSNLLVLAGCLFPHWAVCRPPMRLRWICPCRKRLLLLLRRPLHRRSRPRPTLCRVRPPFRPIFRVVKAQTAHHCRRAALPGLAGLPGLPGLVVLAPRPVRARRPYPPCPTTTSRGCPPYRPRRCAQAPRERTPTSRHKNLPASSRMFSCCASRWTNASRTSRTPSKR